MQPFLLDHQKTLHLNGIAVVVTYMCGFTQEIISQTHAL